MTKEIFSEDALGRLRSPEQLDKMLTVIGPASWMAAIAVALLLASVVLWSIFGSLAVTVAGVGLIMDAGGVARVAHTSSGKIDEILVESGERVKKGEIIATLEVPQQQGDLIAARQKLGMASSLHEVVDGLTAYDGIDVQLNQHRYILSPADGIVSEMHVREGDVITAGSGSICTIRVDRERQDMIAAMYVSAAEAKKVRPGMTVQIAPGGADPGQNGKVMGVVRDVALYPASAAGLLYSVGNAELAAYILKNTDGAAAEVKVELIRDDKSPSGYLWTSVLGTPPEITPGEMCTGSIVVERKPPIEKAFLKLGQWLRFT